MKFSIIPSMLLVACGVEAPPQAEPVPPAPTPASVQVSGWEGFWPWARVDDAWLAERGLPFTAEPMREAGPRVGKLVIAGGPRESSEADLLRLWVRSCEEPNTRSWNLDRCRGIEARSCSDGQCRYEHFGNCSGLLAGGGWFVTAAHCTAELVADAGFAQRSSILLPGPAGQPPRQLRVGEIVTGKTDWEHHWVALDGQDPVDVAAIRVEDGGLVPFLTAPLPAVGEPLFILGYPRVNDRGREAMSTVGYDLVAGSPSVSFGRMADTTPADAPLCNVDGDQEHWALRSPCPAGPVGEGDEQTWTGPISHSPFLATYDSCNGHSGAPVFDAQGRWVGVNFTLASDTNPQEAFVEHARMVATPVARALDRLGIAPAE